MVWVLEVLTRSEVGELFPSRKNTGSSTQAQATQSSQTNIGESRVTYRLVEGRHSAGRVGAAIPFISDKAVSRKHAFFQVTTASSHEDSSLLPVSSDDQIRPTLTVTDGDGEKSSTFGTHVNSGKDPLPLGESRVLKSGDVVVIGGQYSAVRVRWDPLVFCITRTNKKESANLVELCRKLGGTVVRKWNDSVTHLITSQNLVVTNKILIATIRGVPIVKPAWAAALLSLKLTDPLPPVELYTVESDIDATSISPISPGLSSANGKIKLDDPEQRIMRQKHLNSFLFVALIREVEIEAVVEAAGAKILRLYTISDYPHDTLCASSSNSMPAFPLDVNEMHRVATILASPTSVSMPWEDCVEESPTCYSSKAFRSLLASRAHLTPVCINPGGAGGLEKTLKGVSEIECSRVRERIKIIRGERDSGNVPQMPFTNIQQIATALLGIVPLKDIEDVPIAQSVWVTNDVDGINCESPDISDGTGNPAFSRTATLSAVPPTHSTPMAMASSGEDTKRRTARKSQMNTTHQVETRAKEPILAEAGAANDCVDNKLDEVFDSKYSRSAAVEPMDDNDELASPETANVQSTLKDATQHANISSTNVTILDPEVPIGSTRTSSNGEKSEKRTSLSLATPDRKKQKPEVCGTEGGWTMRDGTRVEKESEDVNEEEGEEERCVPEEEEVSLVVREYISQSPWDKKGKKSNSINRPDFKKFRKNYVLYGKDPGLLETIRLEAVAADENERVEQMRREEQEAEEYERQAELLFNDNMRSGIRGGHARKRARR